MPKTKLSVLNTVIQGTVGTSYGRKNVVLSTDDYDRLVRALKREDALRRIAYDIKSGVEKDGSLKVDQLLEAIDEALGLIPRDSVEFKAEIKRLVSMGVSADYIAERALKLAQSQDF